MTKCPTVADEHLHSCSLYTLYYIHLYTIYIEFSLHNVAYVHMSQTPTLYWQTSESPVFGGLLLEKTIQGGDWKCPGSTSPMKAAFVSLSQRWCLLDSLF